jgi:hypothetical protein
MPGEYLINNAAVSGKDGERLLLVRLHQTAIPGDVRSEYCYELALEGRCFHRRGSYLTS